MPCKRALGIDLALLFREPDSAECRALVEHATGCQDCAAALERHHGPPPQPAPHRPVVAVTGAAVVVVAVIALLALIDRTPPPAGSARSEPARDASPATAMPTAGAASATKSVDAIQLALGERREIDASALAGGRPVVLTLQVPAVDEGVATLPWRVYADDGRRLEGLGSVAQDTRESASFSVEADWLGRPGSYIVEVETTEKSHMPLRRYRIEVR